MVEEPTDKKHPIRTKLMSNTFFLALEWSFLSFSSFIFWLLIGKTLLPADFGTINVFINFTTILAGFITLGTSSALFKLIPEYIQLNQLGKITSAIRFTIKIIVITTLISSLIIVASSNFISNTLKIPKSLVWLLPVSLFLYTMFNHQTNIMLGFQHTKKMAITSIIGQAIKVFATIFLISANMSFFGPIIGFMIGSFFIFVTRINYLFYNKPAIKVDGKTIITKFGLSALLQRSTSLLLRNTPPLILALFYSPAVVGIFGIGMLISGELMIIPLIFSSALFPIISSLSAVKNAEKRQAHLINLVLRYSLLITLPALIFVTLFSGELIVLISQVTYLQAKSLIPLLGVGSLLLGIGLFFIGNLYALGKPEIQRNLVILTSMTYLILSFPLTYIFSAVGISIAYAISAFVLFSTSLIYLRKVIHFSISLKNMGKLILANIISFTALYLLVPFIPNIWTGILFTFLVYVFYLFLLLVLRFYTNDDVTLIKTLSENSPLGRGLLKNIAGLISKFVEKNSPNS